GRERGGDVDQAVVAHGRSAQDGRALAQFDGRAEQFVATVGRVAGGALRLGRQAGFEDGDGRRRVVGRTAVGDGAGLRTLVVIDRADRGRGRLVGGEPEREVGRSLAGGDHGEHV